MRPSEWYYEPSGNIHPIPWIIGIIALVLVIYNISKAEGDKYTG